MRKPKSTRGLKELGRVRLSDSFFLRDFLHSEIASLHGFANIPDDPDLAIETGSRLCRDLLEPLQRSFGRLHIRSGYRSPEVNAFGNLNGLNCASNAASAAGHVWDRKDARGHKGAMACIVVPWVWDRHQAEGDWQRLAWWIHDHLPYSSLEFFPKLWAFNIGWHEAPARRITSFARPRGLLTRPGMANHAGAHEESYRGFPPLRP
ncbi:hypothetical protein BJF93_09965 [Xaviernesmea oryzae]|uniref:Peptidase M15 n=1 Tax=Xaviernesmea oryzae TaxID=464029 RepID=A0A1Q9AWW1_9HYPH|nr:hypothetical protein [Xaviernesmea oryzae]OLP59918.1 hypothetical protein BJF93_09965 [Xaviernesmea oryzae]SEK45266.1 hypothetical protein SAMN04487976_102220 [Xaviernesmea oryzae]